MKRRKINNRLLSDKIPRTIGTGAIGAKDFANEMRDFAAAYLEGALEVKVSGSADGAIRVSTQFAAYLLRMLLETAAEDELLHLNIELGDKLTMSVTFDTLPSTEELARLVNAYRAAGFVPSRDGATLHFSLPIKSSRVLHIYAISSDDFMQELLITFYM